MTPTHPRILVGCPTHELKADSLDAYVNGISALSYENVDIFIEDNSPTPAYSELIRKKFSNWEQAHPNNTCTVVHTEHSSTHARERLINGRNKIRQAAIEGKYDFFLSLEQDIIPPTDCIERMLANETDICSGVYLNQQTRQDGKHLVVMAGIAAENGSENDAVQSIGFLDIFPSRVMNVYYCGLGCVLISRKALEKIIFRYDTKTLASDDIYFAKDAHQNGFTIQLDTGILCKHLFNDAFKKTPY